ncbi:MAG: ATP-dependent DNA helicase RecG [Spirochaetaceae bacterium]|jgi:ATP-dependent DNA helicase RecG|nr:ATP-dependent DNA helicase RecG [Spirochaetaceae bacterium]
MFLHEITDDLEALKGLGPATRAALNRLGIMTIPDLLRHYPRDWEDRSHVVPLSDFAHAPVCTVAKVKAHDWVGFGTMRTLKVTIEDKSSSGVLLCFNRPFLEKVLLVGKSFRIWGRFFYKYGDIQSTSFDIEELEGDGASAASGGKIVPVYRLSAGIAMTAMRRLVKRALERYADSLEDELPAALVNRYDLFHKAPALKAIHFPSSIEEQQKARRTLIYEELFYLEIVVGRRALERKGYGSASTFGDGALSPLQNRLKARLPFELTPGQLSAIQEINRDMDAPSPMARLLQGDVGSGKTLVAFLAALRALERGGQVALLAPTELLARQHAENAALLLEPLGIKPAFLTGTIKSKGRLQLLKNLATGGIDLVIGTHALFSKDVVYRNLQMVIVDEQHRFGVLQRQSIMDKGNNPDLLMMSATPIPRTLAFTVFGDLDVSVIQGMPPGRKPVITHSARQSNEMKVYDFVARELAAGRQAYFVYPLIEDGEGSDLKDAVSMARRLDEELFPHYGTALIHSKLDEETKRLTMEAFQRGAVRILVATSVVEVGVDIPNASCMVIEHAERFGLSALHQLRGRVGRGSAQSYCFLVYSDSLTEEGKARLKVMLENNDGFVIAEEDLKLRGPGQIAGTEQSGYLKLGIADPVRDSVMLEQARTDAFAILESDPGFLKPEYRCIDQVLRRVKPFQEVTL